MTRPGPVGTDQAHAWNDLVTPVYAAMGKSPKIIHLEMPESTRHQYQYFVCADVAKHGRTSYNEGIVALDGATRHYIQEYLQKDAYLE